MSYRVSPYEQDIQKIINDSSSNYDDDLKKERFKYYSSQVHKNEKKFKQIMESGQIEEFQESIIYKVGYSKEIMKKDMIDLYNSKFSKRGQPGRTYYNKIKNLIDYCPYCQNNDVKHLDHFLPKTEFPSLSVSPLNLVPLCSDCNTAKRATTGFFNPYFEDVDSEQYLFCDILFQNNDFIIKFESKHPSEWSGEKYKRVESIFTKMTEGHEILGLFNKWSRTIINESKRNLIKSAHRGQGDFEETLLDSYKDAVEEQGINYWKSALYYCLLKNLEETHEYFNSLTI